MCNCNWKSGTYSTLSDPTPRQKSHAENCPANAPTCVECDNPNAKNVIMTAKQGSLVEKHYCNVCYARQP